MTAPDPGNICRECDEPVDNDGIGLGECPVGRATCDACYACICDGSC